MLTDLFVRNLTLIERLELSLGQGLTVFTGETGAGKSILLDALTLIMGGRASIDSIREGADELEVVAQFCLDAKNLAKTNEALERLGLSIVIDGTLIIRKLVARHGRHRQYINGAPATVAQLKDVAEPLIDFTGQHAQQVLLQAKGQLALLDAFADHEKLLDEMNSSYRHFKEIQRNKDALSLDERTRLSRIDWLQFQIDEIIKINPQIGEIEDLKSERERLIHVVKLKEESERAMRLLIEPEGRNDALSRVQEAASALARAARHDGWFEQWGKNLQEAASIVDDVARELSRYFDKIDMNPNRLISVEDRLFELQQLTRKHGVSIEEVLQQLKKMQDELALLKSADESLSKLDVELEAAQKKGEKIACQLSKARKIAGEKFAQAVAQEIVDLGMPDAHFKVEVQANLDSENRFILSPLGADTIRLMFSANPGEQAHSLEKIASGGELSRVMLGIKRVLLTRDLTLVSIFDEIDAGVGGAMGEAIGEKLQKIAEGRQVLCVTHLAQVAARAHAHMKVEKCVVGDRTISTVNSLNKEERIEELARMMGGRRVTDITRHHAREFFERAQEAVP